MTDFSSPRGGSHAFSTHPRPQREIERLRRQALAAWPLERKWLEHFGLTDGLRVLDVGCGPGFITRELAAMNASGETVGLEPDADLVALAQAAFEGYAGVSLHVGSTAQNTLPVNHFDFAYARFVTQHMANPIAELRRLHTLLRPGGKVVLVDADDGLTVFHPEPEELSTIMRRLAARQARAGGDRMVGRKLPHLLSQAGFRDVGFEVQPFTSHGLGRDVLLDLAVSSRLLRIGNDEEPGIQQQARRMQAFFNDTEWHAIACVVVAFGVKPTVS